MSGIYIHGMEMPKSCNKCELMINCDACEGWECYCTALSKSIGYESEIFTDKRREDCPLIPVPPHGRLIDADALKEASHYDDHNVCVVDADDIDNAMTVIPADFAKDTTVPNKRGDGKIWTALQQLRIYVYR